MAKMNRVKGLMADVPMPSPPSPADAARERRYRAEEALRTLTRAAEIRCDSALMRDVKKLATSQVRAVEKTPSGRR